MLQLSSEQRRTLRAQAHSLNPVVSIAENGLSESVLKEINACLTAHALIKIRVYGDDREVRDAHLAQICSELEAAPVQKIGKLLVVFRPKPETNDTANNPVRHTRKTPRRTKRSHQG